MKTIITIQHTESMHHTNGMIGSWTDWDLSEKGEIEAENIARSLSREMDLTKFKIYSSDLKRAIQTAEPLSKVLNKRVQEDTRIRERNLGEACGKSVQWVNENKEKDEESVDDKLFPSGESKRESWERLEPFYREIVTKQNSIIVAHGDILTSFYSMFLGQQVEETSTLDFAGLVGGVSIFSVLDTGIKVIRKINDSSYKKSS